MVHAVHHPGPRRDRVLARHLQPPPRSPGGGLRVCAPVAGALAMRTGVRTASPSAGRREWPWQGLYTGVIFCQVPLPWPGHSPRLERMTTLTRTALSKPTALAAAIALAVATVTAMTMPETTPTPAAEPSGDTAPELIIPAAYNTFCTAVGSVPGDPEPVSCTRIPVTVTAAYDTSAGATQ